MHIEADTNEQKKNNEKVIVYFTWFYNIAVFLSLSWFVVFLCWMKGIPLYCWQIVQMINTIVEMLWFQIRIVTAKTNEPTKRYAYVNDNYSFNWPAFGLDMQLPCI